jgi:hypothetical protein
MQEMSINLYLKCYLFFGLPQNKTLKMSLNSISPNICERLGRYITFFLRILDEDYQKSLVRDNRF